MKFYIVLLSLYIAINISSSTPDAECKARSNTTCDTCLKDSNCGFCKNNKICFAYDITGNAPCGIDDQQFKICFANTKTWIIVLGSVGGVVLIAIIIIIYCFCRKCKQRSLRKEFKEEQEMNRKMEERRAAAEVRTAERNQLYDQIRLKYNLGKNSDSVEYKRFN